MIYDAEQDPYLSACDRRGERIVADGDFLVNDAISKVVPAARHRADENRN